MEGGLWHLLRTAASTSAALAQKLGDPVGSNAAPRWQGGSLVTGGRHSVQLPNYLPFRCRDSRVRTIHSSTIPRSCSCHWRRWWRTLWDNIRDRQITRRLADLIPRGNVPLRVFRFPGTETPAPTHFDSRSCLLNPRRRGTTKARLWGTGGPSQLNATTLLFSYGVDRGTTTG